MLEAMLGASGGSGERVNFVVIPNATFFNEGSEVEFTIYPENHTPGAEYYWRIGGTISVADHMDSERYETEGPITFSNDDPVVITVKTVEDEFKDTDEVLTLQMFPNVNNTTVVGESPEVNVVFSSHPTGSHLQVAPEARQWTVPEGVSEISVVCVGAGQGADGVPRGQGGAGGDLRWRNKIPVSAGEVLTLEVGLGGQNSTDLATRRGGSTSIKRGDGVILRAGGGGSTDSTSLALENVGGGDGARGAVGGEHGPGGGGGAGGYTGKGGVGGNALVDAQPGEGGGSGGGSYYETDSNGSHHATPGGGTGVYGQGSDGAAGVRGDALVGGGGGSGGETGNWLTTGIYGGGARGQSSNVNFGAVMGGNGAIHIVWGPARFFPNNRIVINGN